MYVLDLVHNVLNSDDFTILCAANVRLRKAMLSRSIMGKRRHVESARNTNRMVTNVIPLLYLVHR